jgi:putative DNA primase/helicase
MARTQSRGRGGNPRRSQDADDARATDHNSTDPVPQRVRKVLRLGWSVVPQNLDKRPPVRWREFQERPPTDSQVERWASDFPNCLWAVATGQASGVIVFDFDGDEGIATMQRLGLVPAIRTPRGGAHVYATAPPWAVSGGARLDQERFPNMDLRADGSLATFCGRNRLVDGSYEKVPEGRVIKYEDLPVELQRLCSDRSRKRESRSVVLPEDFTDLADDAVLLKEALEQVEGGSSRNEAGFLLALQLRDERYTFDEAESVMMRYAEVVGDAGEHPYVPQEAYNSLVSAYDRPAREPRAYGKFKVGDGFPQTDYGNAERLVARHGEDVRFCPLWKSWLVWDEQRWTKDHTEEIERRAKDTARHISRCALELESDDARLRLLKFGRSSEQASRLRAMVSLAESEAGVPVLPDQLDSDPWLFNVANGTVDLRTGRLHEHRRNDLITKLAPVHYDCEAEAPTWDAFLRRVVPDEGLQRFLRQAVGYSLTGDTSMQVAFLLWGTGANGKSTFLEVLRTLLGTYSQQAPGDLLLAKRTNGVPNDVARLQGARFVTVSETEEGRQLAEETLKQLTGEDRVAARFLYGEYFEFTPAAKFWLATNHKPEIRSGGEALWRRLHLLPFTVTIPEAKRDRRLARRLRGELPGILRWAVEGCLEWQATRTFAVPEVVSQATEEYREESDLIGAFLDDCCEVGNGLVEPMIRLYDKYKEWAELQGIRLPMTQNALGRRLTERGFPRNRVGDPKVTVRYGVALRTAVHQKLRAVKGD